MHTFRPVVCSSQFSWLHDMFYIQEVVACVSSNTTFSTCFDLKAALLCYIHPGGLYFFYCVQVSVMTKHQCLYYVTYTQFFTFMEKAFLCDLFPRMAKVMSLRPFFFWHSCAMCSLSILIPLLNVPIVLGGLSKVFFSFNVWNVVC